MTVYGVKLPDVGEGIAEAELVEWLVRVGDHVAAEAPLAEVLTDKATVEIASPVAGIVTFLRGEPGELVAIGTEFVGIELEGSEPAPSPEVQPSPAQVAEPAAPTVISTAATPVPQSPARGTASPVVRQRARELGIDLAQIVGSGPDGQVTHADLDRRLTGNRPASTSAIGSTSPRSVNSSEDVQVEQVRGLRRRIAERLTQAWTEIPHITYVDEIDVTELEALREQLNRHDHPSGARLTLLPFVVKALTIACDEQPRLNAHYDAEQSVLSMFHAVHVGIATLTPGGLLVPVLRDAGQRGLWDTAAEITRLATAAREGSATRDELGGSTITITSLGALGGLMTTPIINRPEVAIVGVNKMETRGVWRGGGVIAPRTMCNLSSSFDHRIVDGWDAATFVQRIKALLETPALMFIGEAT